MEGLYRDSGFSVFKNKSGAEPDWIKKSLRNSGKISLENHKLFGSDTIWKAWNFIKKETLAQVYSCEFCETYNSTIFTEHLRMTASIIRKD